MTVRKKNTMSRKKYKYFIKISFDLSSKSTTCTKFKQSLNFKPAKNSISQNLHLYISIIYLEVRVFLLLSLIHFFLFKDSVNFSLMVFEMFWIVFSDSLRISFVSRVFVWMRKFILASEGCGILYPTNSTSAFPLSTTRKRFPNVWSSLLNTYVAHLMSLGY